ncbi:cathepsin D [Malassezia obtusa]|uniref:Cathepsin D n=1 Tax=Malassezia obtusa TaxID=76774 RepID=A0AAF0ISF9_9BASI|nr:cathepsin D [Malassezia obtusa]
MKFIVPAVAALAISTVCASPVEVPKDSMVMEARSMNSHFTNSDGHVDLHKLTQNIENRIAVLNKGSKEKRGQSTEVEATRTSTSLPWSVKAKLGGKDVWLWLDSGSGDLVIKKDSKYQPSKSSSAKDTGRDGYIPFKGGSVPKGEIWTEKFQLGDITLDNQDFLYSENNFDMDDDNDGILGLTMKTALGSTTPMGNLLAKKLDQKLYQFNFHSDDDAKMVFGKVDKSQVSGDFTYVGNSMSGSNLFGFTGSVNGVTSNFAVDSGTSTIVLRADQADQFFQKTSGVEKKQQGQATYAVYDCDKDLGVQIQVGGKTMKLPKEFQAIGSVGNNKCLLSVNFHTNMYGNEGIMGNPFFRMNSVVVDFHRNQVGFAPFN